MPRTHDSFREGATLGLSVATGIWLWIALVDVIAGRPFQTFALLGGVLVFTALHYVLNVAYGIATVAVVHRAAREPSLLIGVVFGFFMLEFAFVMLTVLLSHVGLGALAWVRILGGNLVGAVIAFLLLVRSHPLAADLRAADEDDE